MQTLTYRFAASWTPKTRVHVGVVASGDLEVLLDMLADLAGAVTRPVQWYDIARLIPEIGVHRVVELPPGHVLSYLIAATNGTVEVHALDDEGVDRLAARAATKAAQSEPGNPTGYSNGDGPLPKPSGPSSVWH